MAFLTLLALLLGSYVLYVLGFGIYNIFFHPLSKFPGPKFNAAFRLPRDIAFAKGRLVWTLDELHEEYGEVVRLSPNELSFTAPAARRDIHGHLNARIFQKDPDSYTEAPEGGFNIITAGDEDHSRFRKLLSHSFSDRALKEQEELIGGHVDLLIDRLRERSGEVVDMVKWCRYHPNSEAHFYDIGLRPIVNYTTFDLVGDLSMGATFGCLQTASYHPWVALIFDSIRAVSMLNLLGRYLPMKQLLIKVLMNTKGMQKRRVHTGIVREKVAQRLESTTTRPDFMKYILRHNDEKGMTRKELESNASLLIIAGSETTATLLSGASYYLLQNPAVMDKLLKEIRSFQSVSDMTTDALARCTYLTMVLQEALRMYPPVPIGLVRKVTTEDAEVAGYHVPKGSVVSSSNLSSFTSARNFAEPHKFAPERWAPQGSSDFQEKYQSDHREVFEPFSLGPRNCVGKNLAWIEMRLILARTLYEFDFTLMDNLFNPHDQQTFALWQKPALNIRIQHRGP